MADLWGRHGAVLFQHTAGLAALRWNARLLAGRLSDRAHGHESHYSVEWVPQGKLYGAHQADVFDSGGVQVSVSFNDDAH